jgi:hypothetical protein
MHVAIILLMADRISNMQIDIFTGRERVRKREKPTLTICVQRLEITEEEIEDLNWKCKTKQTCTCADIDLSSN